MIIQNKSRSFLYVLFTDPTVARTVIFIFMAFSLWFFPAYPLYLHLFNDGFNVYGDFRHYLIEYLTNIILIIILYILFKLKHVGGSIKSVLKNKHNLNGKCVLITGGCQGIGLAAMKEFLRYKCDIILADKNVELMKTIAVNLCSEKIICVELDLGNFKSIEKCANTILSKVDKIDIIVNNAGFLKKNLEYIDNIEAHFFVNYLGHFYLTKLLYDCIIKSNTLVINLSSFIHCALLNKVRCFFFFFFFFFFFHILFVYLCILHIYTLTQILNLLFYYYLFFFLYTNLF
uniref:Uncharacterized protein n=1 Tax=Piliocolobus tephrosceles TaxID=591936 RepID=A0A8C9HP21_9PRIM